MINQAKVIPIEFTEFKGTSSTTIFKLFADDTPLSPSAIEMIETNLNDLVQKTCAKYNVAYEFKQCINYINEKSDINISTTTRIRFFLQN